MAKISPDWYPQLDPHPDSDGPEAKKAIDWLVAHGAPKATFQVGENYSGSTVKAPDSYVFFKDGVSHVADAILTVLNPTGTLVELKNVFFFGDPRKTEIWPDPPAVAPTPKPAIKAFKIGPAVPGTFDCFYNGDNTIKPDNSGFIIDNTDGRYGLNAPRVRFSSQMTIWSGCAWMIYNGDAPTSPN